MKGGINLVERTRNKGVIGAKKTNQWRVMKRSELQAKVEELFKDADAVEVRSPMPGKVLLDISAMYEAPGRSLSLLIQLGEFVGTMEIEEDGQYSNPGCYTCDYGSKYGVELVFKEPEGFEWD